MSATTKATSWIRHPRTVLGFGFALGLLVGVGMFVGAWIAMSCHQGPAFIPEMPLHAVATDSGSNFSIATGPVSDGVEGIFALDFLTGDLQCWVFSTRTNQIAGYFRHNVVADLGVDPSNKSPQFVMVTGQAGLRSGGSSTQYGDSILYVADANTGRIVGYGIPWNRTLASRGPQQGVFLPIFKQAARQLEIRGQ